MRKTAAVPISRCIDDVLAGRRTIDECLVGREHSRRELADLLGIAVRLRALEISGPDPIRKTAAREAFVESLRSHPHPVSRRRWLRLVPRLLRRVAAPIAASVAIAVLGTGITVALAQDAMPGEPLYPYKLASEQARVAVATNDASRAEIRLWAGQRRLDELERAIASSDPAKAAEAAKLHQAIVEQARNDAARAAASNEDVAGLRHGLAGLAPSQRKLAAATTDQALRASLEMAIADVDEARASLDRRPAAPDTPLPGKPPDGERPGIPGDQARSADDDLPGAPVTPSGPRTRTAPGDDEAPKAALPASAILTPMATPPSGAAVEPTRGSGEHEVAPPAAATPARLQPTRPTRAPAAADAQDDDNARACPTPTRTPTPGNTRTPVSPTVAPTKTPAATATKPGDDESPAGSTIPTPTATVTPRPASTRQPRATPQPTPSAQSGDARVTATPQPTKGPSDGD